MRAISLTLIIAVISVSSFAQHGDIGINISLIKVNGHIRETYEIGNQSTPVTSSIEIDGTSGIVGVMGGYYYPFLPINDNMAVGAYGGLKLLAWFDRHDQSLDMGAQIPVSILYRFGSYSTYDYDLEIGFGIGGGVSLHSYSLENPTETKITGFLPHLAAEFYALGYVLKINYSLSKLSTYFNSTSGRVPKLTFVPISFDVAIIIGGD